MIYVDDAHIPARVGRINGVWCHMFTDGTIEELHAFAESIGMQRSWFQPGKPLGGRPSRHWHYDVTEGMRARAVKAGAVEAGIRDYAGIIAKREATMKNDEEHQGVKRLGITGSRTWRDWSAIKASLTPYRGRGVTMVNGKASRGADAAAAAIWLGWGETVEWHRADWATYREAAGGIRNGEMVASGVDKWLAFADDCDKRNCREPRPHISHGTADCIRRARAAGQPVEHHEGTREARHQAEAG